MTAALCIFTIGVLRRADPEERSLRLWAAAVVLMGAGTLIAALRGTIPPALAIVLGNSALAIGGFYMVQALRVLIGRPPGRNLQWQVGIFFVLFETYFTLVEPRQTARTFIFSAYAAVVFLYCAGLVLRYREPGLTAIFRGAAVIYLLSGLAHVALATSCILLDVATPTPIASPQLTVGMYAMAIVEWATVAVLLSCVVFTRIQQRLSSAVETTEEANLRLLEMTWLDTTTQVANRARIAGLLDNAVQGSREFGVPTVVCMLAFEGNEGRGLDPRTADTTMAQNAAVIRRVLHLDAPDFETIGRWGDDAFLLVLVGISPDEAVQTLELLAHELRLAGNSTSWSQLRIGVTSMLPQDCVDAVVSRLRSAIIDESDGAVKVC